MAINLQEMRRLLEGDSVDLSGLIRTLQMPSKMLQPSDYPTAITAPQGAHSPDIKFAIEHPKGLYYADHQGAGHLQVYFVAKRKGSRPKAVGGASSIEGAFRRVADHEDKMLNPDAPREDGKSGPVNIFSLGKRK